MKVFFGCTTAEFPTYRKHYFAIRNYLKEIGCVVIYDWLDTADEYIKTNQKKGRNIKKIYGKTVKAIIEADAVVIEQTIPNFSSSHQIHFSLLQRKPTLVLRTKKDNKYFSDSYLEAIESSDLTIKQYNLNNYKRIIKEFIGLSSVGNEQGRYNFILEKQHKYYLDWASQRNKRSRSSLVRRAIEKQIKKDKDYKEYISKWPGTLYMKFPEME